jgi:hypothetical protein
MSTITYDTARTAHTEPSAAEQAAKRKGWFDRVLARMIEARQRQAMEAVRRYGIVLDQLERSDWKTTERSEDSLPFKR